MFAISTSFFVGLISLGQEILWVRYVSFVTAGVPQSFAMVLVLFLFGIALGAWYGKKLCDASPDLQATIKKVLIFSGSLDLLLILTITFADQFASTKFLIFASVVAIVLCAAGKSIVFPMTHQLGSREGEGLGKSISSVYFANVMGATIGPAFSTFFVLHFFTLQTAFVFFASMSILLGLIGRRTFDFANVTAVASVIVALSVTLLVDSSTLIRSLISKTSETSGLPKHIVEGSHGIIHTESFKGEVDLIKGGNAYDGLMTLDMNLNSYQGKDRMLIPLAVSSNPKDVLVIGLSGGSWLGLLLQDKRVERVTVVEINPDYQKLISHYPEIKKAIDDKRVTFVEADGRQWLKRNDARSKFDFVLMNTTFHWRSYISLLLSAEMMSAFKAVLNPKGIVTFNTTGSIDVLPTVKQAFPVVKMVKSFAVVGDTEAFGTDPFAASARLLSYPSVAVANAAVRSELQDAISDFYRPKDNTPISGRQPQIITDENAITEYRFGRLTTLFPSFYRLILPAYAPSDKK
jgi:spermidine synthase